MMDGNVNYFVPTQLQQNNKTRRSTLIPNVGLLFSAFKTQKIGPYILSWPPADLTQLCPCISPLPRPKIILPTENKPTKTGLRAIP